jgi:uncharacterized protein
MVNLVAIREHIISKLEGGLSEKLKYHDVNHTLDVAAQSLSIAAEEGINDPAMLLELEIASLYHDTGFLFIYNGHEDKGCEIAREELPGFGVDQASIDNICGLIMATKVPQSPKNHLQEIICDADLDYLGRNDFFETSDRLRRELVSYNLVNGGIEWQEKQLDFLQAHRYFTECSTRRRAASKKKYIEQLLHNSQNGSYNL